MSTSKHLITALERSDWLDRMLVLAGLAFFVLVVLFILKQRIVDRGLRIALWWTRFVPDFSGDEALLAMEMGKGEVSASVSGVAAAVSTVAVTASTVVASLASSLSSVDGTGTVSPFESTATVSEVSPSSTAYSSSSEAHDTDATSSIDAYTEASPSGHDEL